MNIFKVEELLSLVHLGCQFGPFPVGYILDYILITCEM